MALSLHPGLDKGEGERRGSMGGVGGRGHGAKCAPNASLDVILGSMCAKCESGGNFGTKCAPDASLDAMLAKCAPDASLEAILGLNVRQMRGWRPCWG